MVGGAREWLLHSLLDRIEREDGHLILLGDIIDLWRFRLEGVLERWGDLLDRFDALEVDYIPGNHDAILADNLVLAQEHPLFRRMRRPFTEQIGERRFRFMHGHEVDPFNPAYLDRWGHWLGILSGLVRFRPLPLLNTQDAVTDWMLEWGEGALHAYQWLLHACREQVTQELHQWPDHRWRRIKAPWRTQKMLSRFHRHREEGLYDVAVAGHTHVAGHFSHWYLNSGCWTKSLCSFLKIESDGRAAVYDWRREGERRLQACVWKRCLLASA
jgi:UDP-2,3-diacylglucosamine pyrophosphatase LpxH